MKDFTFPMRKLNMLFLLMLVLSLCTNDNGFADYDSTLIENANTEGMSNMTSENAKDIMYIISEERNISTEFNNGNFIVTCKNNDKIYDYDFKFIFEKDNNKGIYYYWGCDKNIKSNGFVTTITNTSLNSSEDGISNFTINGNLKFLINNKVYKFEFVIISQLDLYNEPHKICKSTLKFM